MLPDTASLSRLLCAPATRQLLRYAFAGFCVTQLSAAVYSALVMLMSMGPMLANAAATAAGLCVGYVVHSRWSFAAQTNAEGVQIMRFLMAALIAWAINSVWVWLLVMMLHLPPLAPVPLMMFVTPWISFLLNRYWVFKVA